MYSISNAVTAVLLIGALLVMGTMTLSDALFPSSDSGHGSEHAALAYTTEVEQAPSVSAEAALEGPSLMELLVAADVGKGERQFAKCKSCHTAEKGGRNGTGPNLYGVIGRAVAGVEGFRYSSSLQDHGGNWTLELMDAWLKSPKAAIPGNNMSFAGLNKDGQRADLIAYLNSLSDAPRDLTAAANAGMAMAPAGN